MSDSEKIVITSEECEQAEPLVSGVTWSDPDPKVLEPSAPSGSWKVPLLAVVITVFVFTILGMSAYCVFGDRQKSPLAVLRTEQTVDQYKTAYVKRVNAQLADPGHAWRKYVEDAHVTVTVTKAYVTDCQVKTINGSSLAGDNGSNISEIDLKIRFYWDGYFDKGGHTDLGISIDQRAGKVLESKIVDTTAMVNVKDEKFWVELGAAAIEVIGELSHE